MNRLYAPSAAVFLILVVGIIASGYFELWERWENFDTIMHLLGSTVLAWFLSALLARTIQKLSYPETALFLVGTVLIFGVVWEVLEHLSGVYLKGTLIYSYYHGGDLPDTIADLVADLAGALAYLLISFSNHRSKTSI